MPLLFTWYSADNVCHSERKAYCFCCSQPFFSLRLPCILFLNLAFFFPAPTATHPPAASLAYCPSPPCLLPDPTAGSHVAHCCP